MSAASLGLLAGAAQLLRRPRDTVHRRIGYVYVGAMAVSNFTALGIYEFTGRLNFFHSFAVYSLFCIVMALRPMLTRPKPWQWLRIHYMWMTWSYVGLWAATVVEFLTRVVAMPGWLAATIGTPTVILFGWPLVNRFAPPRRRPLEVSDTGR